MTTILIGAAGIIIVLIALRALLGLATAHVPVAWPQATQAKEPSYHVLGQRCRARRPMCDWSCPTWLGVVGIGTVGRLTWADDRAAA
jgi:hypothetical protein